MHHRFSDFIVPDQAQTDLFKFRGPVSSEFSIIGKYSWPSKKACSCVFFLVLNRVGKEQKFWQDFIFWTSHQCRNPVGTRTMGEHFRLFPFHLTLSFCHNEVKPPQDKMAGLKYSCREKLAKPVDGDLSWKMLCYRVSCLLPMQICFKAAAKTGTWYVITHN